ncbi:hypothetical protein N2152v2_011213 [Parachlorella kessleri]
MEGTLPVELRQMDALQVLKLDNNRQVLGRFSGPLPVEWGEPPFFPALAELDLTGNLLNGSLPNRGWNVAGSWPALRILRLARNSFWGGLPDGWAGSEQTFSRLVELDLSGNLLGLTESTGGGQRGASAPASQVEWCLQGAPPTTAGWCASQPLNGTFASLELLDLSSNGLEGQLPASWPQMFPRLQTLRLFDNDLSAQPAGQGVPSALPSSWISPAKPPAFPDLTSLVLYPGNAYICSLPDGCGGFLDVNPDRTYPVSDASGDAYDSTNPWLCPGPPEDNPPTITVLGVEQKTGTARLVWAPPGDGLAAFVFGYSLSLSRWVDEVEDWEEVPSWSGRVFRTFLDSTFPKLPQGLSQTSQGGYAVPLVGYKGPSGRHKVALASVNVDGSSSTLAVLETLLEFPGSQQ